MNGFQARPRHHTDPSAPVFVNRRMGAEDIRKPAAGHVINHFVD